MPKKSPSPPLPRVPISDDVYVFASTCKSIKDAATKLICSQTVAAALRRGDRSVTVTPLELASMEMQVRRLTSLTALNGLRQTFRDPPARQMRYVNMMRAVAKFVVENSEELDKFKRKSQYPRFYSTVAWHRPLYEFADMLTQQMIPHMRKTWHDFPECRKLFFGDTGFEEKFIPLHQRTPRKSKRPSK